MSKRKKANPWDDIFGKIKAMHRPEVNYAPRTSQEELDAAETDLNFLFPTSYRAFAEHFGLSGTLGCCLPAILELVLPTTSDTRSWPRSVIDGTKFYRTHDWSEEWRGFSGLNEMLAELVPFYQRSVLFAQEGGYHDWFFDPLEVTNHELREYAIYDVNREFQITRVAGSFTEWLTWIGENYVLPSEGAPDEILEFPPVYKPDSPFPDALIYDRDWVSSKAHPEPLDVGSWLAFNNHAVRDLALSIRDEKRPDVFPILADALEEAGCNNIDMLNSCRTGDPDIDGVWVLRVLLGKES